MDKIKESGENYLETILILKEKKGSVRSVDIVEELGYSKSSVSRGVNLLKEKGYIEIDSYGYISFTKDGDQAVKRIYERHRILTDFLISLGVPKSVAEDDACKIEHVISEKTMDIIKGMMSK
ncbi:MAG: metal-dependent transcriptional regulator [Clostridiales bacterium]|jgi:DtxR family transcriptional regulator, Mn-dependent transcriptional regulator|nr:metal-dependent transcriptional regulator [Clostridiales bacterium]